jgi:hypothetical protein
MFVMADVTAYQNTYSVKKTDMTVTIVQIW